MPMSDGQHILKRIAFQVGGRFFRFAVNPENMTYARPHRTSALKTKSRIIIEDFQSDIPTVTISGTTGFNPTGRATDRGIAKIKEMKQYLQDYAEMGGNGNTPVEDFYFHDFTNDESYVVHLSPEGVTYSQDVNSPLLHRYQIKFIILRKSTDPADDEVIDPEIGNRYPSIPGAGGGTVVPMPMPLPPLPGTSIPMPSPGTNDSSVPMPSPVIPGSGGSTGGGTTQDDIYNGGTGGSYNPTKGTDPINPQAPDYNAYQYGMQGLGFNIGYYGRGYTV